MSERKVYVYTYMEPDGRVWALPYLRHYDPERACVHRVEARTCGDAKKAAMLEHKACITRGVWTSTHPDGHVDDMPCTCPPSFVPRGRR
jgi:hypothetical protein